MKKIFIIFKRETLGLMRTRIFRISILAALATAAGLTVLNIFILKTGNWLDNIGILTILITKIGTWSFFISLGASAIFIWVSQVYIIKDKENAKLESLLACPCGPKAIWLGKGLALYLPAFIASLLSSAFSVCATNLTLIVPAAGHFIFPASILIMILLVNPVLFLGLILINIVLSLTRNIYMGIIASFMPWILSIGIIMGMLFLNFDLLSWSFFLLYACLTAVVWLIVFLLSSFLDKERIILSL